MVVTAYPLWYPPSCRLQAPASINEELQVSIGNGSVCEVGPGRKDFVQNLSGVERLSLLFWQICDRIESPHCFNSHPGVLTQ
jgi:hypothetical protein